MSDKSFKVKAGLQIPSVTSANILTTDSSGNVSSSSTLAIANGGTGQTTANNALNALLPSQTDKNNYFLQTNQVDTQWAKAYYQGIQNDGTTVNPRNVLNIVGGIFEDDSVSDITTLTFPLNAYLRESFTPTANQTDFTLSSPGMAGSEQVFLNGILLVKDSDYTTPDSETISLSDGAAVGDILDVMVLTSLTSAGALSNYKRETNTAVSSDITLESAHRYFVDTTSARTLTLPASPSLGDEITIFDASGESAANNITIARNGKKIDGLTENAIIDVDQSVSTFIYTGATLGWRFM